MRSNKANKDNMISMVDKQSIIHLKRVDNMSGRGIARKLGISRKCVIKVLKEYEEVLSCSSADKVEDLLTKPPRYNSSKRPRKVVLGDIKEFIDKCIEQNQVKRGSGLRKQCMRKQDIYRELRKKELQISYSSVCKYVTEKEKQGQPKTAEAFIRQEYEAGQICEFDWGEVKLKINGSLEKLYIAVFTLCYSNGRFAYLFRHQDTLAFLESHRNFFRDVDGVPAQLVYDNMRVAISKFVEREKKPTQALLRMSTFYGFGYRFCNIRRGNEKGHVERSVEFVRRRAFCMADSFDSIGQAQAFLTMTCEELNIESHSPSTKNIETRFPQDLAALGPKNSDMGCFEIKELHVDKWSTVCLGNVHFSVPDKHVGKVLAVKNFSNRIQVIIDGKTIAEHEKPAQSGWCICLEHYLDTFKHKPGALAASTALRQAPQIIQLVFNESFSKRQEEFVKLLVYMREKEFSADELYKAYICLRTKGLKDISPDQLAVMMHAEKEPATKPITDDATTEIERNSVNTLKQLSALMNKVGTTILN